MDCCLLCLEFNKDFKESKQANSSRWEKLNITKVLEKHFWPMNAVEMNCWVCLPCWQKVEDFHKFYLRIENAHLNLNKIQVDAGKNLQDFKKDTPTQEIHNIDYCCLEPEIIIDYNTLPYQANDGKEIIVQNKVLPNLDEYNSLEKTHIDNEQTEKVSITSSNSLQNNSTKYYTEELIIKPEPSDYQYNEYPTTETYTPEQCIKYSIVILEPTESSDNDFSGSANDDNALDELDNNCSQIIKKNVLMDRKENEKIIAEHFKQMSCDLCGVPFVNFTNMQKHFSMNHNQKGYLVCCNKKYYKRVRLVGHLYYHLNPDQFKCTQCDKIMSTQKEFKNHMERIHSPNDVVFPYHCKICDKSYALASLLRKHNLKHLPDGGKPFSCTECFKSFSRSYLLKQHVDRVHLKKIIKICSICNKTIGTSTEYKIHMDQHQGIPPPIISCDICGLRVTNKKGLWRHKVTQHPVGGKQEHRCPICPKISPTKTALRKHINTMHEKGHDHKCNICEKAFRRAQLLKEHMALHTGTPLFTCPWCPKTFNSSANMYAHRRKLHTEEWKKVKLQKYDCR